MYKYPYGDSQQLNLDWIIAKLKELEEAGLGLSLEEVANALISLTYNTSTAYRRYDYAFRNGKLYRCLSDTTGAFDPSAWQEALIGDDLAVLTRWINAIDAAAVVDVKFDTSGTNGKLQQKYHDQYHDVVEVDYAPVQNSKRPLSSNAGYELNGAINSALADIAPILTQFKADAYMLAGVLRIYNNQLYKTTQIVQNGDDLVVGSNVKLTDVNTELARGDLRNITRSGNYLELAAFYGTTQTTIALNENAQHFAVLLMQLFNSTDEVVASCFMPTQYFRNVNVKIYGEGSSQWGSFQLSADHLSGTFNRTSTTTNKVRIIGFSRLDN